MVAAVQHPFFGTFSFILEFFSFFDFSCLRKDGQRGLALFLRIPVGWNDSYIPCIIFLHDFRSNGRLFIFCFVRPAFQHFSPPPYAFSFCVHAIMRGLRMFMKAFAAMYTTTPY